MNAKCVLPCALFACLAFGVAGSVGPGMAEGRETQRSGGARALDISEGNQVLMQLSTPVVSVRRDTSYGLPYGSVHSRGISSIVWGNATPGAMLVVTLTRSGSLVVTRTVTADQGGSFSVSVDRLIEDGDIIQVSDGASVSTVQVPTMMFHADPTTRIITGIGPPGIITTEPGAPHSLQISIGGKSRQVTTTATGEFSADFTASPYLAGLLGTMRYTTPDGDRVYKPLYVADPLVRGELGDWRADVILGQPDFSQITFNEVVGNKLFNPGGVYVDRSVQPNRVYVYDAGNSRVLGLSHLGTCAAGANAGQNCTSHSDCPGSTCQIQEGRLADIVLGQPSFDSSTCNGDSGYQMYPDVPMANAQTLCGLPEEAISVSESGSGATMATDAQGNLYVPDFFNNRVLRYNEPFTTDTVADYVWGQADFFGTTCNRGVGFYGPTDARSVCLTPLPSSDLAAGVAVDSAGNLWVADNQNNRVLRFPFNPALGIPDQEADLVLGQLDFSTIVAGAGLGQMRQPASVRVDNDGVVYVADSRNQRVLVFEPPFSNGMQASRVLGGLYWPTALEIDAAGGLWVNDCDHGRYVRFVDQDMQEFVAGVDGRNRGGLGVDSDGNVMGVGWNSQEVRHFSSPTYDWDSTFLRAETTGIFNKTGPHGLYGGRGLEVTGGQLIYADGSRILFWNDPWSLTNYQAADGVVGEPDFYTRERWGAIYQRMRADERGRLWVIYGDISVGASIYAYDLPLKTGATPVFTISSPLALKGGGVFTWSAGLSMGGVAVEPNCDCLWLSDPDTNRVFRIRNASTGPVVDVVLGQLNASGTQCNQGRGRDFPSQDSLCHPGALAFDQGGNLWVADHNLEVEGNHRLLEFDASTIPDEPTSAVFGIPATRVFGRDGDFAAASCPSEYQDPMCGPWEPAFDTRGRMVIGFNAYIGPRFPLVYQDPLTNPLPIAALGDFHSMPLSARFDSLDNLYILDHNRSRILIYRHHEAPNAPSNLTATAVSPTQINLSWQDDSSDESDFHIERSPTGSGGWTEIATAPANTTSYPNTGLSCGITYHYRVRVHRHSDGQYSAYSNVAHATTDLGRGFCDRFCGVSLASGWTWVDPLGDCSYSLTANPGQLRLYAPDGGHDLYSNLNSPRVVQPVCGDFSIGTHVSIDPVPNEYQGAGLLIWQDEDNYIRLELKTGGHVRFLRRIDGTYTDSGDVGVSTPEVYLRFERQGNTFTASYSQQGSDWTGVGTASFPATQVLGVGVHLINEWQDNPLYADFDYFEFEWCAGQYWYFLPLVLRGGALAGTSEQTITQLAPSPAITAPWVPAAAGTPEATPQISAPTTPTETLLPSPALCPTPEESRDSERY